MEYWRLDALQAEDLRVAKIDDPLHWGIPTRFRADFNPIGTPIRVESNREAVIRVAQDNFGRYGRPCTDASPKFLMRVCVDPVHRTTPPWPKPSFRSLNHLFHIACGDSNFAIADLNAGVCIGFVTEAMVEDSSFFKSAFLDCLFYVLAVHHAYTPVHCSGVASGERGVLICGTSGSGKTTLAYACARSGLQVLSDDVVHLRMDPANNQLRLWGRPWFLRLAPQTVDLFPELRGLKPQLRSDHEWYLEVDVEKQFPGSVVVSCEPEALVFLERHHDAASLLQPLDVDSALERLLKDIHVSEAPVIERHRQTLARLLQTQAYVLSYSGDPVKAVEVIRSILHSSNPRRLK
jgi:hypothetical protein